MKYYTYYPACCSFGQARAYDMSTRAVAKALDIELIELDDWNCCGSTPYSSIDELGSICCSARNLSLAEKRGLDLVTPCSDCYLMLNKVNLFMKEYPELKSKVAEAHKFLEVGAPDRGPFHSRRPDRIVRKTVRGMVPWAQPKGKNAYKRLKVYLSIPQELKGQTMETDQYALASKLKGPHFTLGELAVDIGWNQGA